MTRCLLHPSLPFSSLASRQESERRVTAFRCCRFVPLAAASSTKRDRRGEDDYHDTLRALNCRGRHTPRKSLGQHYMLNQSVNDQLAGVAEIKEGDVVLEIGPGTGSLTNVLVEAGATVFAVEKDLHMAELVRKRFKGMDQLVVLQEDFTKCNIRSHITSLLEEKNSNGSGPKFAKVEVQITQLPFQVVANLPFNISTEVIKQLLPMGDIFSEVVLLLQDEAALRLVNCSSEYRPINIFVNFYSEYKFKVERSNFFPRPNVDAAAVTFKLKIPEDYPHVTSIKNFFSMVNCAFNGKRKMLRKTLVHFCSSLEIEDALSSLGLPTTSRPEELTLADFVKLHSLISRT